MNTYTQAEICRSLGISQGTLKYRVLNESYPAPSVTVKHRSGLVYSEEQREELMRRHEELFANKKPRKNKL